MRGIAGSSSQRSRGCPCVSASPETGRWPGEIGGRRSRGDRRLRSERTRSRGGRGGPTRSSRRVRSEPGPSAAGPPRLRVSRSDRRGGSARGATVSRSPRSGRASGKTELLHATLGVGPERRAAGVSPVSGGPGSSEQTPGGPPPPLAPDRLSVRTPGRSAGSGAHGPVMEVVAVKTTFPVAVEPAASGWIVAALVAARQGSLTSEGPSSSGYSGRSSCRRSAPWASPSS